MGGYHISCNGASDGSLEAIIVGGQPPYAFQWSTGAFTKTITGLTAGTYSITVTDAAQASITKSYTLIASEAMNGSLTKSEYGGGYNVSAQGASDGWITAVIGGGATPYSYQWSNGAESETNHDLSSGSYSVIVRDVNQCQLQLSANLTQPTPLHIVSITSPLHNGYNLSCKGSEDGAIDLTVSGGVSPYTYQWSNGNFTQDLADLKAGEYTVLVKDLNGVGVTASITLTQPASIEVELSAPTYPNGHHTTCYNCSNGSVTTTVTGGVMPYVYSWNTGQSTQNLANLMSGTYAVQVTDANGCTKTDIKIDLTQPDRDDWTMTGNYNTDAETQFIGTSDSTDFVIRSNSTERIRFISNGEIALDSSTYFSSVKLERILSRDSVIHLGDRSLVINTTSNQLFSDRHGRLGIGIGGSDPVYSGGTNPPKGGTAFGFGMNSVAIGNYLRATAENSIVIGSGEKSSLNNFLVNNLDNSLYVGFNSNIPTMVVTSAGGVNSTGNVGIGTGMALPTAKLDVNGDIRVSSLGGSAGFSLVHAGSNGLLDVLPPPTSNPSNEILLGNGTWLTLPTGFNAWITDGNSIINSSGFTKVGINTISNPIVEFEVNGSSLIRNNLEVYGNTKLHGFGNGAPAGLIFNNSSHELISLPVGGANEVLTGPGQWIEITDLLPGSLTAWTKSGNTLYTSNVYTNVGIGVQVPTEKLEVSGNIRSSGNLLIGGADLRIGMDDQRNQGLRLNNRALVHGWDDDLILNFNSDFEGGIVVHSDESSSKAFRIIDQTSGKTNFQVMNDGEVYAREITLTVDDFPDYVFQEDYELITIDSLKAYINNYGHLPGVPSRDQVMKSKSIKISEMQLVLLKKIEELTLYLIKISEENQQLKKK